MENTDCNSDAENVHVQFYHNHNAQNLKGEQRRGGGGGKIYPHLNTCSLYLFCLNHEASSALFGGMG